MIDLIENSQSMIFDQRKWFGWLIFFFRFLFPLEFLLFSLSVLAKKYDEPFGNMINSRVLAEDRHLDEQTKDGTC